MNSGLVPQQPPTNVAPALASSFAALANSSGVVLYFATPPTISGSPALGFIQTGRSHAATRRLQIAMYSLAPTPQFAPIPCTPSLRRALATCSGVAPMIVRSRFFPESQTKETITGKPVSSAAAAAIL